MKIFSSLLTFFSIFLLACFLGILLALFLVEQSLSAWVLMLLKSFREFFSNVSENDLKVQIEHLRQQLDFLEEELGRVENRVEEIEEERKSVYLETLPPASPARVVSPILESTGSLPRVTSRAATKLLK